MANVIPGKAYGLRFDDIYWECQTALNFENSANLETTDPCKPDPSQPWKDGMPQTQTVSSTTWTASVTAKATDAITGNQVVAIKTKAGKKGSLEIFTNVESTNSPLTISHKITGNAVLQSISLTGDQAGEATYTLTFTGDGDFDSVAVPVTP